MTVWFPLATLVLWGLHVSLCSTLSFLPAAARLLPARLGPSLTAARPPRVAWPAGGRCPARLGQLRRQRYTAGPRCSASAAAAGAEKPGRVLARENGRDRSSSA